MIKFDDEEMQKEFNECHFRQEYDGVDVCRGWCTPCMRIIESGKCSMLEDYFAKKGVTKNDQV